MRVCAWVYVCALVALLIQHVKRMSRVVIYGLSGFIAFATLPHKRHDFWKKVIEHKMCVLIFFIGFIGNISHSKRNSVGYCHKCENVFM